MKPTYIHPTAIIGKNVKIGYNCYIGPYCIIGEKAEHKAIRRLDGVIATVVELFNARCYYL